MVNVGYLRNIEPGDYLRRPGDVDPEQPVINEVKAV